MAIDPDRFEDIGTGDSPFARRRGGTPAKLSSSEALKASIRFASELFRIAYFSRQSSRMRPPAAASFNFNLLCPYGQADMSEQRRQQFS
jgi:hypothetical protein